MIINVDNAEFGYQGKDSVFEGVSFSVEDGEILSILGPNGTGKTSLLKCLNGLFQLTKGTVSIDSEDLRSMKKRSIGKKVGYVPQIHDLTFPYTVLEMVLMGRAPHLGLFEAPTAKDVEIADEVLKTLGIFHLKDCSFSYLSGGEAQLVLIARALSTEPKAILLDEPTSHLDFKNQAIILNILEHLAKEKNIVIIMTTHFPDHALAISDKALLMTPGKGCLVGKTKQVINEKNLLTVFGIDVRIISLEESDSTGVHVVPIRKRQSNTVIRN